MTEISNHRGLHVVAISQVTRSLPPCNKVTALFLTHLDVTQNGLHLILAHHGTNFSIRFQRITKLPAFGHRSKPLLKLLYYWLFDNHATRGGTLLPRT